MRCQKCSALTADNLLCDGDQVPFHDSFAAFEASAKSGCELCTVLFWNIQKFRWGRDERLLRYAELAECSDPLAVRWSAMGKNSKGHVMHCLDVVYRDQIGRKRLTYSILQYPAEGELPVFYSERKPPYAERISEWMRLCEKEHTTCRANSVRQAMNPARPARLLDVQPEAPGVDVRLVHFGQAVGPYAALSYSWGDQPHGATTTFANILSRMESITLTDLPRTFTDAIAFCRVMGVRYLWVDALCIIQPRPGDQIGHGDWEAQSGIMGYIYANAIFTIAAQGASSADIGLFPSKVPFDLEPRSCPLLTDRNGAFICVKAEPPDWVASVGESALQERAWVLQERLLSTRLIHFTQHAVFWECAERCASEFEPEKAETGGLQTLSVMLPPSGTPQAAAKTKDEIILQWQIILADYSGRKLSFDGDKFPAISAIAERVALLTQDTYIAGMWESRFFDDLLWSGMWKFPSYRQRSYTYGTRKSETRVGDYVAPSWSWASVTGWISHDPAYFQRRKARVVSVSVSLQTPQSPFGHVAPGASLKLAGRIRHNVYTTAQDTTDDDAPWHDLWFEVPKGDALANKMGNASTARHSGLGAVWFDVAGDHINEAFSVIMMTETSKRDGLDSDEVAPDPDPRRFSSLAMLIARVEDGDGLYRIGQANISDINFFVGCREEIVEII